jgi:hypothetical protein
LRKRLILRDSPPAAHDTGKSLGDLR